MINQVYIIFKKHLISYPTPSNLTYLWNFGSASGLFFFLQIITGLLLTVYYIPTAEQAFDSVEHIIRDVNYGWLVHHLHSNGASFFFFCLYCHMFRGWYYASFNFNYFAWLTGCILFILFMAVAFLGYVLPWGQMSFWGATVITNLFSVVPLIGNDFVSLLWGNFAVSTATLGRFYTLHFLLPLLGGALIILHIYAVHLDGSSQATRTQSEHVSFTSFFIHKDLFAFSVLFFILLYLIAYYPHALTHPDNYIPADPLVTPTHIVPEWYFLPYYAMLRSIPNKILGVIVMFSSIIILTFFPLFISIILNKTRSILTQTQGSIFSWQRKFSFWIWIYTIILLGWLGSQPAAEPYINVAIMLTCLYFALAFFLSFIGVTFKDLQTWYKPADGADIELELSRGKPKTERLMYKHR